jgi:hypothetical protein
MSPVGIPPPPIGLGSGHPTLAIIGTGKSIPPGLESKLEFNGLILNDRSVIDTYKVIRMSGLEDADIRDDREVNPQAHGETAFDSYYGGKTITIEGTIRAFNLAKLRDMQQALKYAFADLSQERPLVFHGPDPENNVFINCKKNTPIAMTESQESDGIFYRPFLITLRASNFRFLSSANVFDYGDLAQLDVGDEDPTANYDITLVGGTAVWVAGEWNFTTTAEKRLIWKNQGVFPLGNQDIIVRYTPDATLTGSSVKAIVKYLDSSNYLYAQVDATGNLTLVKVDGGAPTTLSGPVAFGARAAGVNYYLRCKIEGNVVRVDHYASDPRGDPLAASSGFAYTLTGGNATKFGSATDGRFGWAVSPGSNGWSVGDISYSTPSLTDRSIMTETNKGNFQAQPRYVFTGPMTNPVLTNTANIESLVLTGSVPSDDSWTVNIAEGTMYDNDGDNRFNNLSPSSDWVEIEAGDNDFLLTASAIEVRKNGSDFIVPSISVNYRHSWI